MQTRQLRPNMALAIIAFTVLFGVALACARAIQSDEAKFWSVSGNGLLPASTNIAAVPKSIENTPAGQRAAGPRYTPTPDAPHPLPTLLYEPQTYIIEIGDTLGNIAQHYGVSLQQIINENGLLDPDHVEIGQVINIPPPEPDSTGPSLKIVPDSELVYGPSTVDFDLDAFVREQGGYLQNYQEEVDEKLRDGAQIVELVAHNFSVNPRLLLAILEYQSGWVTKTDLDEKAINYPVGLVDERRQGLYRQLAWAATQLNRGYYVWRVNGVGAWLLGDGSVVPINPTINAGTAGVQQFFASLLNREDWLAAISETGVLATYEQFFGYPFLYSFEPVIPADLVQPVMQLPFEADQEWAYTGGPHAGWGDGSAWAALDFAPPGEALGCVENDAWVIAVADGLIIRAENGAVVQDLDGDGKEQTGWSILYMHVEKRQRVEPGTYLKAGERIGHPSCEGGVSTGTHVHLARRYNGEWISADQGIPFVLDGWISQGDGYEYNGYLYRNGKRIEAYAGRSADNGIHR